MLQESQNLCNHFIFVKQPFTTFVMLDYVRKITAKKVVSMVNMDKWTICLFVSLNHHGLKKTKPLHRKKNFAKKKQDCLCKDMTD